ncbi:MAG TPA: aldo/keto reductase [Candidatus Limnocylindrales bacterium]|nr:aldo/keto reductase [Candidatus Limnocylindrales bacterium]
MIERIPFGSTGHRSSRVLFGAAALWGMKQDKADRILELLLAHGVNHIDTAASYGDSELRVGSWMLQHRQAFFLATKTGERTYEGAWASLRRSLARLQIGSIDLIQLHNLVDQTEWDVAMGPGGALEALVEARDQGLVRFIGVTGHGASVARQHRRSIERFAFDSVLLPYNYTMMKVPGYAADFEALVSECHQRGIAVQTIKSVARRRWQDQASPHFSWYEPLRDEGAVGRGVAYVLSRPGLFLNSSSDATLLPLILQAAERVQVLPSDQELAADVARFQMQPLFFAGQDAI